MCLSSAALGEAKIAFPATKLLTEACVIKLTSRKIHLLKLSLPRYRQFSRNARERGGAREHLGILVNVPFHLVNEISNKSLKNSIRKWHMQPRYCPKNGKYYFRLCHFTAIQIEKINFPDIVLHPPLPPSYHSLSSYVHRSCGMRPAVWEHLFEFPPLSFRRRDLSTWKTAIPGFHLITRELYNAPRAIFLARKTQDFPSPSNRQFAFEETRFSFRIKCQQWTTRPVDF